jgi:hypothetical protein
VGLGNNPVNGIDPDGRWFLWDDLAAAGIGFAAGYLSHGITSGEWGKSALLAGGIGALTGWLAYNTAGLSAEATGTSWTAKNLGTFATNQALGMASSQLPSPSVQVGNFSFGLSPAMSTSGLGINGNIGYSDENISLGVGLGLGYNTGTNDLSGEFFQDSKGFYSSWSVSGGANINGAFYGGTYGVNNSSGKAGQKIGYFGIQAGDFSLRLDEDWLGDKGDRWKTGGGTVTYRLNSDVSLAVGLGMITGEKDDYWELPGSDKPYSNPSFEKPYPYRGGAFYGGIIYQGRAYFGGINSEKVLHSVQNFIHKHLVSTPYYFQNEGYKPKTWSYFGNYSVNTLIY